MMLFRHLTSANIIKAYFCQFDRTYTKVMTPWVKVFNKTQAESQLKYSLTVFAHKSNLCRGVLFYNKVINIEMLN